MRTDMDIRNLQRDTASERIIGFWPYQFAFPENQIMHIRTHGHDIVPGKNSITGKFQNFSIAYYT